MNAKHVYIYGDIVNAQTDPEVSAQYGFVNLKTVVDQAGTGSEDIVLHIHSRGGEVDEGFAIYDFLVQSKRKVTTKIEGLCNSIATIIALSGSEREMTENSTFMIHNPWGGAMGDADEIAKYADSVKKLENKIINFYAEKTGASVDDIQAWMKEEKSMTAEEAKNLGFVTNVIKTVSALAVSKSKTSNQNSLDMTKISGEIKAMRVSILDTIKSLLDPKHKPEAVKNMDAKTNDGKTLVIETDADAPAVGDKVTLDGNPAPDGDYTLENGTVLTVAGGAITVVKAAENKDSDEVKNLKKDLADLKAQNATLTAELTEAKETVTEVLALAKELKSKGFKAAPRAQSFASQNPAEEGEVSREDMEERRKNYKAKKTVYESVRG